MIKEIALLKRKQGLSLDEFAKYYKETFAPLALRHLGMKRYVLNFATSLPSGEQPYDAVAEVWWDDMQAVQAASEFLQSENGKVLRDSLDNFADFSQTVILLTEESVIK